MGLSGAPIDHDELDEFAALEIESAEDFRERFTASMYFGCEADDPSTAWAFADGVNPFGAKLRAMFGSDIGHWDVIEMDGVVEEVYEMVERGQISEADLRAFSFTNPVQLHGRSNPAFFDGTSIESAARALLAGQPS